MIECGYTGEFRVAPVTITHHHRSCTRWRYGSCRSWHNYETYTYKRTCPCKSDYFERGQECIKCQKPCLTCSSETQCITWGTPNNII